MVVPPVVVSAGETDRAIPAAVVIETAMRPGRDKGVILQKLEPQGDGGGSARQPRHASFLRVMAFWRV